MRRLKGDNRGNRAFSGTSKRSKINTKISDDDVINKFAAKIYINFAS